MIDTCLIMSMYNYHEVCMMFCCIKVMIILLEMDDDMRVVSLFLFWYYDQDLIISWLWLMVSTLWYVIINFDHEKYPRLHVLWWIKIDFMHASSRFYACNYGLIFDVEMWSLCNVINELYVTEWLCIYVWNLLLKRWSLDQDLCHDMRVYGWWIFDDVLDNLDEYYVNLELIIDEIS